MRALVVSVAHADVELASDVLWSLGVVAIEERVTADGVELWTSLGEDSATLTGLLAERLGDRAWRFADVDESVAETWRAHAEPIRVDADLVVCPRWVPFTAPPGVTVVRIEPGPTFGLGDHPTTVLSLRAMRAVLAHGGSLLDVGCGSGVLAVTACVLGARSATAVDISPASVPITAANAAANGVADRVHVATTPLGEIDGCFDVVVANILAPTLIDLAGDLRRVVAPSGALVVSGVLADRHDHVEAALRPLHCVRRDVLDGWAALTLRVEQR